MYSGDPQQNKKVNIPTHVSKTSAHITPAAITQKVVTIKPMYWNNKITNTVKSQSTKEIVFFMLVFSQRAYNADHLKQEAQLLQKEHVTLHVKGDMQWFFGC